MKLSSSAKKGILDFVIEQIAAIANKEYQKKFGFAVKELNAMTLSRRLATFCMREAVF